MTSEEHIAELVRHCYWEKDINCARTMLHCLSELRSLPLDPQLSVAAIGMNGAGRFRGQCGLVEGVLMFLGVSGAEKNVPVDEIVRRCGVFAAAFQERFGSISCRDLRPNGFRPDDPPHYCEKLTLEAVVFALNSVECIEKPRPLLERLPR